MFKFMQDPMWERVRAYIRFPLRKNRVEIRCPADVALEFMNWEVPCVSCGVLHHPVRARQADALRIKALALEPSPRVGTLYLAATCSAISCVRGEQASMAMSTIKTQGEAAA